MYIYIQVLIPAEFVFVAAGQSRANAVTGELTASMIRHSAVRPDDRYRFITNEQPGLESPNHILQGDPCANAFGFNIADPLPMAISATLLPHAKIQYGGGKQVDPGLSGTWSHEGKHFMRMPPNPVGGKYPYGIMCVANSAPRDYQANVQQFQQQLEKECTASGTLSYEFCPLTHS